MGKCNQKCYFYNIFQIGNKFSAMENRDDSRFSHTNLIQKSLSWTMRILYLIKCLGKVVDNVVDMFDAY